MYRFARWKVTLILSIVFLAAVIALPNALPQSVMAKLPSWLPAQQINLGLDLRGGSHLLYAVDRDFVITEKLDRLQDEVGRALKDKKIGVASITRQDRTVRIVLKDETQSDAAEAAIRDAANPGSLLAGNVVAFDIGSSGTTIRATFNDAGIKDALTHAINQSMAVVRKRVDALGTSEPVIQRQGEDRIIVQVPGEKDPERLKATIGKTAKLTFHLVDYTVSAAEAAAGRVPPGTQVLYTAEGQPVLIKRRALLGGESLTSAKATIDSQTGQYVIAFTFDTAGARRFGEITRANVDKQFAAVLDGKVLTAPVIQGPILGGSGQISGNFDSESANDLAVLLSAGALPAPLKIIEERNIGAELGADSINAGVIATIIGSIAVLIFMVVIYGLFGVFADIAVIINVVIILALVTLLRSTLTLPGIAGIVLTVGMAVDSNVLIYERIKEELKSGKTPINALEAGFNRAFATILDANLTTLIAALILFQLGSGPVRGFAVTHAIGTLTTIFTAFTMTRLMIALWVQFTKPKRIPIDPRPDESGKRRAFRILPEGTHLPFMKFRHIGAVISVGGAIISMILFGTMGLNYSIDFKGGTLLEITTPGPADLGKLRAIGGGLGLGSVQVQEFGSPEDVLIRIEAQPGGDEAQQVALATAKAAFTEKLGPDIKFQRSEVVGPVVGAELARAGLIALAIAIGLMMVYVWFRFEWQFGLGAVLALFHDVFLTIGIFALFRIEFGLSIIAAILTIIGYSMNDTVVIYDRIRENLRKYKKMDLLALIDLSLNETLSRTTMTAVTTLLALFALYIFGGEVIRNFVFAMIWGVFIGTYSSVFIAGPFIVLTNIKRDWSGAESKPAAARTA